MRSVLLLLGIVSFSVLSAQFAPYGRPRPAFIRGEYSQYFMYDAVAGPAFFLIGPSSPPDTTRFLIPLLMHVPPSEAQAPQYIYLVVHDIFCNCELWKRVKNPRYGRLH